MKITIKKEIVKVEEKEVDVVLSRTTNGVLLMVDDWDVFKLNLNGTGRLIRSIGIWSGLKVDEKGKIVLEN